MVKAFKVAVASAALAMATLSIAASAHAGHGSAVGAGLAGFGIGAISVARSRRERFMSFRRRLLRRSITHLSRTDRRHGRPAGMTTARGDIRASTRKRDISWVRTGALFLPLEPAGRSRDDGTVRLQAEAVERLQSRSRFISR